MKTEKITNKLKSIALLLILLVIAAVFEGRAFFSFFNIMNILLSVSVYGIMICGSIFPLLVGGMDLSIGSVAAFSAIVGARVMIACGFSLAGILGGIFAAMLTGGLIGLLNGIVSYYFEVPALLATISTQYIFYAVAQLITENRTVSCGNSDIFEFIGSGTILGIPFPVYIMVFLAVLVYFILNKTVFGRQVYAVGGNVKASRMVGVNAGCVIMASYILSGIAAALGGIVLTSMNTMVKANTGYGYELYVFIGLMVGGVNFAGGEGTIQGGLFGALLVGVLSNVMMMVGIDATYHNMIQGIVIIIAVALTARRALVGSGMSKKASIAIRHGK